MVQGKQDGFFFNKTKTVLFPGSRSSSRDMYFYVQYLAGCLDLNPSCWTETAAVLLMSYIHTSHIHDGFFYTDKEEVEDGAEDCVEDDGPQVAHEHPVVEGVGRLC